MEILAESLVRSTLIAAGVALALKAMRVASPSVRHSAWAGVMVVMLLLPAQAAWGPRAPVRLLPADEMSGRRLAVPRAAPASAATQPDAPPAAKPAEAVNTATFWRWRTFVAGGYVIGLAGLLLRLAMGTWQVRRLIRDAVLRHGRLTHAGCVTPVTVGWIRPRVILPQEWSQWPPARLDAILTHEGEHVRRRDPLVQWLALLNRAVFWFHPLAWWLARHVPALAEEASDAAVLARGHDPHDYSCYLLDLARSIERAGGASPVIGMAMPGTNLPRRIERILDGVIAPSPSRAQLAFVAIACVVSTTAFALATPVQIDPPTPAFEVTSIRLNKAAIGSGVVLLQPGGRVTAPNVTVDNLVRTAYGLFEDEQLIGGPSWLDEDRFSIETRASATASVEQVRLMLRRLLVERFGLVGHSETRQLPLYELARIRRDGSLGSGLRRSPALCAPIKSFTDVPPPPPPPPPPPSGAMTPVIPPQRADWRCPSVFFPGWLSGRQLTMPQLAQVLTQLLRRNVMDRTGLDGVFDVDFTYAPESVPGVTIPNGSGVLGGPADGSPADPDNPVALALTNERSLFSALREELGLELQSTRGPIKVFVIDRVARPSEN